MSYNLRSSRRHGNEMKIDTGEVKSPERKSRSRSRSPSPPLSPNSRSRINRGNIAREQNQRDLINRYRTESRNKRVNRAVRFQRQKLSDSVSNSFQEWILYTGQNYVDLLQFLRDASTSLYDLLRDRWIEEGAISWQLSLPIEYEGVINGNTVTRTINLNSDLHKILTRNDIRDSIDLIFGELIKKNQDYNDGGSNWRISKVEPIFNIKISVIQVGSGLKSGAQFGKFTDRRAGAYIPVPNWLQYNKGIINVKNKDDQCFRYSMECALLYKKDMDEGNGDSTNGNREKEYVYKNKRNFQFDELEFPIHPLDLEKFEELNKEKHNLAINVYAAGQTEQEGIGIVLQSKNNTATWIVSLLIVQKFDTSTEEQDDYHWVFIKDLSLLLRNNMAKTDHKRYLCTHCLNNFATPEALYKHRHGGCIKQAKREILPKIDHHFKYFKEFYRKNKLPWVIYADFEAFNKQIEHSEDPEEETKTESNRKRKHIPSGYCIYAVCSSNSSKNILRHYTYEYEEFNEEGSTDVIKKFIDDIVEIQQKIATDINFNWNYPATELNDDQKLLFEEEKNCCVCNLSFKNPIMQHWFYTCNTPPPDVENYDNNNDYKEAVKEYWTRKKQIMRSKHSHETALELLKENSRVVVAWNPNKQFDNYIGACHYDCKKHISRYDEIPVVFHNLSNYDEHFIIKNLKASLFALNTNENLIYYGNSSKKGFRCIPLDGDKFMTFSFMGLKFIDSYRFLSASLSTLVENLRKSDPQKFVYTDLEMKKYLERTRMIEYTPEIKELMLRKGVFPYEWFDEPMKLEETEFPPIEEFFSSLSNDNIKLSEWQHGKRVWNLLNIKVMQNYHDIYMIQDVLLLADVFETFRKLCEQNNNLEPLWYVSLPGYTMDSAFSFLPGIPYHDCVHPFYIELFDERQPDMYYFIEQAIRGGVSMTPGRYSKANNPFIPNYNIDEIIKYIMYFDITNLYGYGLSSTLPSGGYLWIDDVLQKNGIVNNIEKLSINDPIGYFLEIDAEFPNDCHDYLKDFPPAPVNDSIFNENTSPYYQDLLEKFGMRHDNNLKKLLCPLYARSKYIVHYRNLQQYTKLGMVVTKVHRVLQFNQSNWLEPYVTFCTQKRAQSKNDFEKDFYKLLVNSLYGKFIQNNRKFKKVVAVGNTLTKNKWDPYMESFRIINKEVTLMYLRKGQVDLYSSVIVGACVLEHAKWLMYHMFYDILKGVFDNRIKLLFTDTDSLCVEIIADNPMQEMKENKVNKELETDPILQKILQKSTSKTNRTLDYFDMSGWPQDDSYYGGNYHNPTNKKLVGTNKDEMVGIEGKNVYILEVVAFRSKMYSILTTEMTKNAAKGISRAVKKQLTHEQYVECLNHDDDEEYKVEKKKMTSIQSKDNELYLVEIEKATLNPVDSKVFLVDAFTTLPYGHKDTYRILSPYSSV